MPTKAELQATVNDLTKQLKKVKENTKKVLKDLLHRCHVEEKASKSHHLEKVEVQKELEKLKTELNKIKQEWTELHNQFVSTSKERDELNKKLNSMQAKLQKYVNENHQLKRETTKPQSPWDKLNAEEVINKMYEQRQETPELLDDPHPEMTKFPTGAVRSSDADGVRYDLITPVGLRRLAETYKEGSLKYGDNNWQKGFPASDVMNHAIRHMYLWLDGDKTEDHLAHAAWNLLTIMHFEERKPECIDVASRNPQH